MPPLPNQVFAPSIDLKSLGELGQVVIISLAVIVLAVVLYRVVSSNGASDKEDRGLLKQMIDLATSYKTESAEARDAYKAEAAATRAVVQESNAEQRATRETLTKLITATHEQTTEIRKLPGAIEKLRFGFEEYQSINADEIEGFRQKIELLHTEMVAFKGEIKGDIESMLTSMGATRDRVNEAVNNHGAIFDKLDSIIALFPVATITPLPDPASGAGVAGDAGGELPTASGF